MRYVLIVLLLVVLGVTGHEVYNPLVKRRAKIRLVRSYKKFYLMAISEENQEILTRDHMLAIGQRVIDDHLNKLFEKYHYSEAEKINIRRELELLILKECPEIFFKSSLIMTDDGFHRKV